MTKKMMVAELLMNNCFGGKDPQANANVVLRVWRKDETLDLYNKCKQNWEKAGREWKKA